MINNGPPLQRPIPDLNPYYLLSSLKFGVDYL